MNWLKYMTMAGLSVPQLHRPSQPHPQDSLHVTQSNPNAESLLLLTAIKHPVIAFELSFLLREGKELADSRREITAPRAALAHRSLNSLTQ